MNNVSNVIFMRHGHSRAEIEGVHEGRYDSPLTERGRIQAESRALEWQAEGLNFDCIITSSLRRASETAEILGRILKARVEVDPNWMEVDNGPLAGLPIDVAKDLYPEPAFLNPYQCPWLEGESKWELYCRAARAVGKIIQRGTGQFLVVSHGAILNAALRGLIGATPSPNMQGIWFAFGDTGFARTVYYPDEHRWVLSEFR